MYAQISSVAQVFQDRIGDGADAHLHGRTIGYQFGDVRGNFFYHWILFAFAHEQLGKLVIHWHHVVQTADMDEGVAQGAWHLLVYLCDDDFR